MSVTVRTVQAKLKYTFATGGHGLGEKNEENGLRMASGQTESEIASNQTGLVARGRRMSLAGRVGG